MLQTGSDGVGDGRSVETQQRRHTETHNNAATQLHSNSTQHDKWIQLKRCSSTRAGADVSVSAVSLRFFIFSLQFPSPFFTSTPVNVCSLVAQMHSIITTVEGVPSSVNWRSRLTQPVSRIRTHCGLPKMEFIFPSLRINSHSHPSSSSPLLHSPPSSLSQPLLHHDCHPLTHTATLSCRLRLLCRSPPLATPLPFHNYYSRSDVRISNSYNTHIHF